MKAWEFALFFLLGLSMMLLISLGQDSPGYMDAEYYYVTGRQIATGGGAQELFLWNYLDDPAGLPHPAFTYWMPLAALISAAGMIVSGGSTFINARLFFFIAAGLVAPLTAWLAYWLTRRTVTAWTAGGLALFSGFYAVYLGLTETFAVYMLLGGVFVAWAARPVHPRRQAVVLGLCAGLMHLARADGLIWLALGLAVLAFQAGWPLQQRWRNILTPAGLLLGGYLAVMAFWYGRNLGLWGSLFPAGAGRAMWLVEYDQLFSYPAAQITAHQWLEAGLPALLRMRWEALLQNLQTLLAVQGGLFLLPLTLAGGWRLRRSAVVQIGATAWLLTFVAMTFVFPLAGARGGFLHSGAAVQPLLWVLAAEGLAVAVEWGARRLRHWKLERAFIGFGISCVVAMAATTIGLTAVRLAPSESAVSGWNQAWEDFKEIDWALQDLSIGRAETIMINDPPGFYAASGRPAVVIPYGGVKEAREAAERYHVTVLILEENTVRGLIDLYQSPRDEEGLMYLGPAGKARIFRIGTR